MKTLTSQGGNLMKKHDKNYNDFSNRKPFNNIPCRPEEVLVPVVVDDEMKITLKNAGLIWDNLESWHFPYSSQRVPVAFIQVDAHQKEFAMKDFNTQARAYLNRYSQSFDDACLSLDQFLEDAEREDSTGFNPTGSTLNEDNAFSYVILDMLVDNLNQQNPLYGQVFRMLFDGYKKGEILDEINLGTEKSQGYGFIKKVQKAAGTLYNKHYQ
jgi:hypothetical protein